MLTNQWRAAPSHTGEIGSHPWVRNPPNLCSSNNSGTITMISRVDTSRTACQPRRHSRFCDWLVGFDPISSQQNDILYVGLKHLHHSSIITTVEKGLKRSEILRPNQCVFDSCNGRKIMEYYNHRKQVLKVLFSFAFFWVKNYQVCSLLLSRVSCILLDRVRQTFAMRPQFV